MTSNAFDPIAIVGLAGRFPGAADTDEFWRNLRQGRESVAFLADEDLLRAGVPASALADPSYVRAVAQAPELDMFDAGFFGLTPREARLADPQIRLFLEVAHSAMENAGYDPERVTDVGVFGSTGLNRYVRQATTLSEAELRSSSGMLVGSLNNPDYVATLVSYKFNFHGPSMTLMTACSSSLVAVQLAAQALTSGQCELAIAGGVDIEFPVNHGYWWAPGSPYSRDGHCRPFDASASGTLFGSGAGAVILRRLSDALADGDPIRAVVRGLAVNNDGSDKVAFSAPSVAGQRAVISEALAIAQVDPCEISLVEAHGTGTPMGDPIELTALREAFERLGDGSLTIGSTAVGSVKGNIGHLGHAAGVVSLIKVALALENECIPQVVNLDQPNPKLPLDGSPFFLPDTAQPWPRVVGRPRLAGLSSLGIGGTNVHAVIEEAPPVPSAAPDNRPRIVVWSAKTAEAADAYRVRLADHFTAHGELGFADAVGTLRIGRTAHPVRSAVVTASAAETVAALTDSNPSVATAAASCPVVFLLPGQGAQHAGMAADLYARDVVFAEHMDRCLGLFAAAGFDVREVWLAASTDEELADVTIAQPLMFSIGYALAQTWIAWGVRPDAVLGHSIGELAATTVAGVFDLPDAVRLVAARTTAMAAMPPGRMVAVAAAADAVEPLLIDGVGIAASNAARQTVVSGNPDAVSGFEERAQARGLATRPLGSSLAFHSPMMVDAVAPFRRGIAQIHGNPPRLAVYSAATGALMTAEQAADPTFWSDQLTRPVLFADALDAVAAGQPGAVLLECGPGRTLTALARQHSDVRSGRMRAVPTLPARRADPADERRSVLQAAAVLWTGGRTLDWAALEGGTPVHRTPMPGYPYQRERFWIDAEPVVETPVAALEPVVQVADAGPVSAFSVLAFAESSPSPSASAQDGAARVLALLPADRRCAADLAALLWQVGMEVIPVWPGDGFARTGAGFQVRPGSAEDFRQLFGALADPDRTAGYPELIVHAWTADDPERWDLLTLTDRLDRGFHSLLTAVQQGARQAAGRLPGLLVLTTRSVDVSGAEEVDPARAMLHGLVRTLALEEPRTSSALIDIGVRVDKSTLTAAIGDPARPVVSALRGNRRWVRVERPFTPTPSGQPVLRRRGSYLLTGGLGGLGLAIAKGLARSGLQPKLVLLGRHGPTADARAVLAELESMGAEVHTVTADVTDAEALAAVVKETGPFQGVFHLAGVRGNGMLHVRDRADATATLAPKVHGTAALVEVFAREPALDLFVGFGSRAAIDGLIGGGDYAAANAFLASVAENGLPGLDALSGRIVSIDWPSWTRVGMAVESLAADRGRREQSQGVRRWQTVLSVESYAALDEHRLGPTAVLPGTGHLDLILRAFRAQGAVGDERPVRLSDVFFRQPLAVPHECQLEVTFEPDDSSGWTFQVRAAATGAGPDGPWTEHVSGRIGLVDAEQPRTDVGALLAALPERTPCIRDEGLFTLGPRWDLDPQINSAPGSDAERLLTLTLPDVFADEAVDHELHPTLLDAATSSTRLHDEPGHLPLMYRELTVYKRLTPRLFSHIRRREAADGLLVADIDLLSPDGAVLARIGGYTMRRLPETGLSLATPAVPGSGSTLAPAADEAGIPPQVGVDLLFRILDDLSPRARIAVRPFRGGQPVPIDPVTATQMVTTPSELAPVPPSTSDAIPAPPIADAPTTSDLASRLAALWTEALGIENIAPSDNFFELGGNSLMAVDLTTAIRSAFGVDIGIAALFDFPTVSDVAAELRRLGVSDSA